MLECRDRPGDRTMPRPHPDSVTSTLSSFRRLVSGDTQRDVALEAGTRGPAVRAEHHGKNIGETASHALFVELRGPSKRPSKG